MARMTAPRNWFKLEFVIVHRLCLSKSDRASIKLLTNLKLLYVQISSEREKTGAAK